MSFVSYKINEPPSAIALCALLSLLTSVSCGGFTVKYFQFEPNYTGRFRVPVERLKTFRRVILLKSEKRPVSGSEKKRFDDMPEILNSELREFAGDGTIRGIELKVIENPRPILRQSESGGTMIDESEIRKLAREHNAQIVLLPFYFIKQKRGNWSMGSQYSNNRRAFISCPNQVWRELYFKMFSLTAEGEHIYYERSHWQFSNREVLGRLLNFGGSCRVEPKKPSRDLFLWEFKRIFSFRENEQ